MHVRNLRYPTSLQIGGPNSVFRPLGNVTATSTAYIFATKHGMHNQASALSTTRGLLRTSYQSFMNFGPWTASDCTVIFIHPIRKFCFLRHCQASQTDTSKQKSTKLCQTVDNKLRYRTVGVIPPKKIEGQDTFTLVRLFDEWDLMVNIFWMEHEIDNRVTAW